MMRAVLFSMLMLVVGCADRAQKSVEPLGPSIYPINASLVDQRGARVGLDVDRGHPVIIAMFYGSCPSVCPLILSDVKRIDAMLPAKVRDDARVLLVSFDGEHDTPAELARIARERGIDGNRFTLASGSDDDVRTIAAALGVTYRALPEGGFSHDYLVTTLDREGRPTARIDHAGADVTPLVSALSRSQP